MIVFGLGNPGPYYARTRHNVGFMVVDLLTRELGLRYRSYTGYDKAQRRRDGFHLILIKPTVYMNNSGEVVKRLTRRKRDSFLIVCDDLNLSLGRIRIRTRGSDGGHNGLASIIYHLQSEMFTRLRVGIGPLPKGQGLTLTEFVLAPFLSEELPVMKEAVSRAAQAVLFIVEHGVEAAMNRFNG